MNKIIDIALKDLSQSFRSAFALIFMFGVPLMVAGIFYFMFGNRSDPGFDVPITKVIIANMDEGDPQYAAIAAGMEGEPGSSLGSFVGNTLSSPDFAFLLDISTASSAEQARRAVDQQQVGVAVIMPPDFSRKYMQEGETTALEIYADPTLTLGPGIVQSLLKQIMDGVSGAKIAVHLAQDAAGTQDQTLVGAVMTQYLALQKQGDPQQSLISTRSTAPKAPAVGFIANMIGLVLGGMSVFYSFYTGFATGQSILREEERKTLPRLFTTPTPQASILAGKFLAVFLTVIVQITVLLLAGRFIFQIDWGSLGMVILISAGTVLAASTFGIFFNSLLKSSKQSGAIFGGVITITGMVGMIPIFTMGVSGSSWSKVVSLFVPQGWAVQAFMLSMQRSSFGEIALLLAGLLVWSIVFFAAGIWRFNHRYI
jgi:ABC-2 type transport system permease protein